MYDILIDGENTKAVFAKYSPLEAAKVKHNIDAVLAQCKIPSQALLEQMIAEGIPIDGYELETTGQNRKSIDLPGSVIRTNLFRMFLNIKELMRTVEPLSTGQLITVRELWLSLVCHLALDEGADELLLEDTASSAQALEQTAIDNQLADVKSRLAKALHAQSKKKSDVEPNTSIEKNNSKVLSVKNKLNGLATVVQLPTESATNTQEINERPRKKVRLPLKMPFKRKVK